jgi:predicted AlkP superfamily pyrophosphatase or phosphodiesterase
MTKHLVLIFLSACAPTGDGKADRGEGIALLPKALVVGIDGVRADAAQGANTPHLDGLIALGRSSMTASTQTESVPVSGPGWASILTGAEPTRHGVYTNDDLEPTAEFPTFLHHAKGAGLRTAAVYGWADIASLFEPDATDHSEAADDAGVASILSDLLRDGDFDVHFAHFNDVDSAGHGYGYAPDVPEYMAEIEEVDGYLGDLLAAIEARPGRAEEAWLVITTTDHGGLGTSHSLPGPETNTIPFVLFGDGLNPGTLPDGVVHTDTHPSVLSWFGVAAAQDISGVSRSHEHAYGR